MARRDAARLLAVRLAAAALAVVVAACAGGTGGSGGSSPGPSGPAPSGSTPPGSTPSPSGAPLAQAVLKYRLVDQLGRPYFCDPDEYPVGRGDIGLLARQRLPEIRADAATWAAITAHLGLDPAAQPTADEALAIYTDWKMLRALALTPADQGAFAFDYVAHAGGQAAERVSGTIDAAGGVHLAARQPSAPPPCPICLARGTRIATPSGEVPVESLRVGQLVWTSTPSGERIAAPLVEVGSSPVPPTHRVVDLRLADGRELEASPGHRLADGRPVGSLRPGDRVGGSIVASASLVAYAGGETFDLLPAGATGAYWADGILLASTLGP